MNVQKRLRTLRLDSCCGSESSRLSARPKESFIYIRTAGIERASQPASCSLNHSGPNSRHSPTTQNMPPSDQPIANVWALISLICTHLINLMPPEDSGDNCLYRTYDSGLASTSTSRSGASPSIKTLPSGANITSQEAALAPATPSKFHIITLPTSHFHYQQMKRLRRTIYRPLPPPNTYPQPPSSQPQFLQM